MAHCPAIPECSSKNRSLEGGEAYSVALGLHRLSCAQKRQRAAALQDAGARVPGLSNQKFFWHTAQTDIYFTRLYAKGHSH